MYAQETTPETMPGSLQDMDPDMAVSWGTCAAGLQTDELGPSPSRQVDGASVAGSLWEDGSGGGGGVVGGLGDLGHDWEAGGGGAGEGLNAGFSWTDPPGFSALMDGGGQGAAGGRAFGSLASLDFGQDSGDRGLGLPDYSADALGQKAVYEDDGWGGGFSMASWGTGAGDGALDAEGGGGGFGDIGLGGGMDDGLGDGWKDGLGGGWGQGDGGEFDAGVLGGGGYGDGAESFNLEARDALVGDSWATAGDGGWGAGAAAPPSPGGAQGVEEQGESSEIEFA